MFAKYPETPSESVSNTTGGPRRRIRCKMCRYVRVSIGLSSSCLSAIRQELATREHMLDHGQLGPATPAESRAGSRRPSSSSRAVPRRPSGESARRRPSRHSKFGESLSMSSIETTNGSTVHPLHTLRNMSRTSMDSTSALDIEDESETELNAFPANSSSKVTKEDVLIDAVHISGPRLFDAIISTATDGRAQLEAQSKDGDVAEGALPPVESPPTTHFINPSDISSQSFANPALAALRSANSPVSPSSINSPLILLNTKCSGYFVEPVSAGSIGHNL